MAHPSPLSEDAIRQRLDRLLEVEFSFRDTSLPAAAIARLPATQQAWLLEWVQRVASTHVELGYQLACKGVEASRLMSAESFAEWLYHAMDRYDAEGLRPALLVLEHYPEFAAEQQARRQGALLRNHEGVLNRFLQGLSGRPLKLAEAEVIFTDSETLYLPTLQSLLPTPQQNFELYKVSCALLWAQIRFGTLRALLREPSIEEPFLQLFHALESLRLEACLERELPGLHRSLLQLEQALGSTLPEPWEVLRKGLSAPDVDASDVIRMAHQNLGQLSPYPARGYQGTLKPERVRSCMEHRVQREKARFRVGLNTLLEDLKPADRAEAAETPRLHASQGEDQDVFSGEIEILLDDMPLPLPEAMQSLKRSILLDLGEIPDDYLQPAGPGEYDPSLLQDESRDADDVWHGSYHEEGAWLYDEWDFQRSHYRRNWCAMRERQITPVYDDFVNNTLQRHHGLIKHLRKTFEALRHENRRLKRQREGEDVDLDALVEALSNAHLGFEMSDRLLTRMQRNERNIAVIFMVDMSGSTKGWINDAERESLILLCEALESLGDRYAIYGFSGMTRKRCELFPVKRFDETYDDEVKARISGIRPQDYTRMGFAIRHLSALLRETEARTRILITLSDGKPDDYDGYRGQYGIEDTRRALVEARRSGVHPYCITIDEQARDYLPHLYGPAAYSVVDDVRSLPLKVSDIYRRLTT
ncbi:MAG: nitric oxide reductase activation protein [Sedimenticola sp.]|nr:nitric oxide reductase activation protein [Sedimenticola sp.]